MKKSLFLAVTCLAAVLVATAQTESNRSVYDPHALFSPLFYTYNGNSYRAATGEPGPDYWQNRVDYRIDAKMDEEAKQVSATVTISYTNNSPQQLPFLWLQLDQNLFSKDSRGQAKMPATGRSRYGDASSEFDGGYKIKSVQLINGTVSSKADYLVNDSRMQVRISKALAGKG